MKKIYRKIITWIKSAAGVVSTCLLIVGAILIMFACSPWGNFSERAANNINNILFGIGTNLIGIAVTVSFVQFFLDRQSIKKAQDDERDKILCFDRVMQILIKHYTIHFNSIVTPMPQREKISASELKEDFSFSDMKDLYLQTLSLHNKFYEPAIKAFYDAELNLREYCIELITKFEFKYNPDLIDVITRFVEASLSYDVRDAVLGNIPLTFVDSEKTKYTDFIRKEIAGTSIDWVSRSHDEKSHGNMLDPFVCLFDLLHIERQLITQYLTIISTLKGTGKK